MHKDNAFEQAGADLKNLKHVDMVMPLNPRYTAQEWQEIYAAQNPSPEYNPNYKKGTEPQPGKGLLHTFEFSS
jgi:hypothetical protein